MKAAAPLPTPQCETQAQSLAWLNWAAGWPNQTNGDDWQTLPNQLTSKPKRCREAANRGWMHRRLCAERYACAIVYMDNRWPTLESMAAACSSRYY